MEVEPNAASGGNHFEQSIRSLLHPRLLAFGLTGRDWVASAAVPLMAKFSSNLRSEKYLESRGAYTEEGNIAGRILQVV